jgi:transposase-like protein
VFSPPRCPFPPCPAHRDPSAFADCFWVRNGTYLANCRRYPQPRFKCRQCGKGFSRQTFRADYHDKKPHLNGRVFKLLASGMGLRQSARILGLSRRSLELKARKISRHLGRLNRNLIGRFPEGARFMLDEMETFEGTRAVLPVTVPVLIEAKSMFVVATDVAPIKPSGRMTKERRRAIQEAEERLGKRQDRSKYALGRVFRQLKVRCGTQTSIHFCSDKKHLYATLLRRYFGDDATHTRISSKEPRNRLNPLKHINLTNAMARDLNGRLRRESWLVSKERRYLRLQLHIFAAYRNFVRRRINREQPSPAEILGFVPRRVEFEELLTWRQDWKQRSIHPLSGAAESIPEYRRWRVG